MHLIGTDGLVVLVEFAPSLRVLITRTHCQVFAFPRIYPLTLCTSGVGLATVEAFLALCCLHATLSTRPSQALRLQNVD